MALKQYTTITLQELWDDVAAYECPTCSETWPGLASTLAMINT